MKATDTLTTLFQHNLWANLCLFEACAALTPEQLQASIPGAFGTIIQTLEHIASSEHSYFSRISTGRRSDSGPLTTFAAMIESLRRTGLGLIEWAPKVRPEDTFEVDWDGTPRYIPKTFLLTQALQHAAEHREQIKAIMTEIGVAPPDLQGWEFFEVADRGDVAF